MLNNNEDPTPHSNPPLIKTGLIRIGQSAVKIAQGILSFILALVIIFAIRSSLVEIYRIPTGSMKPTLLEGDHIFVKKFAYRLIVPFTDRLTKNPIVIWEREPPRRGQVIVFKYPKNPDVDFIKRVIGLPGDIVELKNNRVYINRKPLKQNDVSPSQEEQVFRILEDETFTPEGYVVQSEKSESSSYIIINSKSNPASYGPVTVPENHVLVLGDNRNHSNDSRVWGFVAFDQIKGRATMIWLSFWADFTPDSWKIKNLRFRKERIGIRI